METDRRYDQQRQHMNGYQRESRKWKERNWASVSFSTWKPRRFSIQFKWNFVQFSPAYSIEKNNKFSTDKPFTNYSLGLYFLSVYDTSFFDGWSILPLFSSFQEVRFLTHEDSVDTKLEREIISKETARECYAHQKQTYSVELNVPPTPPSDTSSSGICKIRYYLLVWQSNRKKKRKSKNNTHTHTQLSWKWIKNSIISKNRLSAQQDVAT